MKQKINVRIRYPWILKFCRWVVPVTAVLLILFLSVSLLVENHAHAFFYRYLDPKGKFKNYLVEYDHPGSAFGWLADPGGIKKFSTPELLFFRFAFNLHVMIVYVIDFIFSHSLHQDSNFASRGSSSFDALVAANAGVDLILVLLFSVFLSAKTTKGVKITGLVFLFGFTIVMIGLPALQVGINAHWKSRIASHKVAHYPFLDAGSKLIISRDLQQLFPLFGFFPFACAIFLLIDCILAAFGCGSYAVHKANHAPESRVQTPQPMPTQPMPTQPMPTQPMPTQPMPTQPMPTQPMPTQPMPTQPMPTQPMPTQPMPTQPMPTQPMPTQPMPTQPMPTQPMPTQPMPTQPMPTQPMPTQPMPTQPMPTQPKPVPDFPRPFSTPPKPTVKPAPAKPKTPYIPPDKPRKKKVTAFIPKKG